MDMSGSYIVMIVAQTTSRVLHSVNMVQIEVGFKSAPDSKLKGKTKRSTSINASPMHFSWHSLSPRLVLTSKSPDFDPTTISHWREEGFTIAYLPYDGDVKAYRNKLLHLADPLKLGDKYALIGTGLFSLYTMTSG